jgi:NitT/TauT family transport system ATP-binding protein
MPSGTRSRRSILRSCRSDVARVIRLEGVAKVFISRDGDEVDALDGVSLEIRDHAFVCLVGPSGCGKSTMLRLIGGLVPPTRGLVKIDGAPVTEPSEDIGIVFQAPTLLPWASVLDNVLFPLKMMGRLAPESRDRAMDLLELVGLAGFEKKYPRELSGGMQQRAGICRALIHDPSILLMDEPFGALDALTREELTLELLRIWTERPKTIVFVTHSISEAAILADEVVVMSARPGRIAEIVPARLPRPRHFDMGGHREFQECTQRIRALIFGEQSHRAA